MDTILGNIGEPLRVDDEDNGEITERDVNIEELTNLETIGANPRGQQLYHTGA